MAISQIVETKTLTLIQETAADTITIRRQPIKNAETGKVNIQFFTDIGYSAIQYQGESATDRDEIIRTVSNDRFSLTPDQVNALFGTKVTLEDGTETVLGELLATLADDLIEQDITVKTKNKIRPWLLMSSSVDAEGKETILVNLANPVQGVTYTWKLDDASAEFTDTPTGISISKVTKPCVVTCEATETASGIKESATINLV